MKAKSYIIVFSLLLLGFFVLGPTVCNPMSKSKPGVHFDSGKHATGEKVKTPLQGSVIVRQQGKRITFSLGLRDAEGKKIRSLRLPTGRPKPPKVEILNTLGERVYACTLEYG